MITTSQDDARYAVLYADRLVCFSSGQIVTGFYMVDGFMSVRP